MSEPIARAADDSTDDAKPLIPNSGIYRHSAALIGVKALLTELAHGQMREEHGSFCFGLEQLAAILDREIDFLNSLRASCARKASSLR